VGDVLRQRIRQARFDSPAHEAMLNLLVAAGHVRLVVDQLCEEHGITQAQYNALRILRGARPDGYPRGEIACRLIDRAPDVTRLIDRLEVRGLVERARVSGDRRLSITRITRAGLDLLRRMDPGIRDVHQRFASRLSARDLKELSRICERLYGDEVAPAAPAPASRPRRGA
jgi:DNA-binding MarR family transcriptional regulator